MRNVLILGAGISGLGAAHVLAERHCHVVISDPAGVRDTHEKADLENAGCRFVVEEQTASLLSGIDTVVVSPVVPRENPVVQAALQRNIPVISEIELAYRIFRGSILAVTGTNGKTTATTLLGRMLEKTGLPFAVGGNIGTSLSRIAGQIPEGGYIAAELSSFQLEFIDTFSPKAAVILNITPDHMERHHTMEAYVAAKARIFENMGPQDSLLLNQDDAYTMELAGRAKAHVYYFSSGNRVPEGACVEGEQLLLRVDGQDLPLVKKEELQVRGAHNIADCLAAAFLAYKGGVPVSLIREALLEYTALEHRIEYVRTLGGVDYYNDSKATNTDAVIKALESFTRPVILIAGGHDKETPIADFMQAVKSKVKHLVLLGAAAHRFKKAAVQAGVSNIAVVSSMETAIKNAQAHAEDGDIVLLSPACSSFDMYHSYEERGRDFKRIVHALS